MAIYHYGCNDCGHDFEAVNQSPSNPQTICPECKKKTLRILIDSAPKVRAKDYFTKGGQNALMYQDLNKGYKKAAEKINRQAQVDAAK